MGTLCGHHVNPCRPVGLLWTPWGLCGDTMSTHVTLWDPVGPLGLHLGPHKDSVGTPCHPMGPRGTP